LPDELVRNREKYREFSKLAQKSSVSAQNLRIQPNNRELTGSPARWPGKSLPEGLLESFGFKSKNEQGSNRNFLVTRGDPRNETVR
jgi:hypothetical protein